MKIEKTMKVLSASLMAALSVCTATTVISAENDGDDLRAAVQNPISSLVSLPFKFNFDYGAANGDGTILNIQPVYPITKGDWNYVSRLILPVASVDGAISTPENPNPSGLDSASGLGDINYSLYLSPVKYGKVIWGVGPSIMMPTASDDNWVAVNGVLVSPVWH